MSLFLWALHTHCTEANVRNVWKAKSLLEISGIGSSPKKDKTGPDRVLDLRPYPESVKTVGLTEFFLSLLLRYN